MDKMNNKTDRYFRDKLGGFEQSPPDAAWHQIALKLKNRKKKRAVMIFFRIAAGMAILLSTGMGVYLVTRNNVVTSETASTAVTRENYPLSGKESSSEFTLREKNNELNSSPDKITSIESRREGQKAILSQNESNEDPINNITPDPLTETVGVSDETSQHPHNEFAMMEIPVTVPDTIIKDPLLTAHVTDSAMTPEEAIAVLLAQSGDIVDNEKQRKNNWSVGSEIAPLYSYRSINSPDYDQNSSLNTSESGILAYAGGFRVALNTGKRLSVQSGVYYSRYGQEINQVVPVASENPSYSENNSFIAASNSTGTISGVISSKSYTSSDEVSMYDVINKNDYRNGVVNSNVKPVVSSDAEDISLRQYFDYFEVPLIVKYKVIDRKIDFSFSGGLVTNFLVGNAVNVISDGKSTQVGETTDIREFNYLGSIGMGLEYPVVERFSFTLEPRFRYYINPIHRSAGISVHPFSFGFFAGINYRF